MDNDIEFQEDENENSNKNESIRKLIEEFTENRQALKSMITDLEKLRLNIDKLFPDTLDKRYMRFFEEKIKSATELFKAILDVRKEISKSLKTEIELISKTLFNEDEIELTHQELSKLTDQVDKFKSKKLKQIK
jgi:uncharacterized protein Yka (UPF0111/DUF47 family)